MGSDDGLVHMTANGGESWSDVSPPHKGEAMINAIELSPHDPGTAYLAVTGFKLNDFKPYIYKTTDYGKRWKRIDRGLPDDTFVRVVREDPTKRGLLYAGTEAGMFVSFNDGDDWQSLQLNLPPVPVTDLQIRQDNLVASTQGRGFWVVDDLFVIRQAAAGSEDKPLHVYAPQTTYMIGGGGGGKFEGKNPAGGAQIYYHIRDESDDALSIEILDAERQVIRQYSSEENDHDRCRLGNIDPRRPFQIKHASASQGMNLWNWNMRSESVHCIPDARLFGGFGGPTVAPGYYSARVSIGDAEETVDFKVALDPRVAANDADIATWVQRQDEVKEMLSGSLHGLEDIRTSRSQIEDLMAQFSSDTELQSMGAAALEAIAEWESRITQLKHQTYEDEDAWETMLSGQLRFLLDVIDGTGPPVTDGAMIRLRDLSAEWASRQGELQSIADDYIAPINEWAKSHNVEHVLSSLAR